MTPWVSLHLGAIVILAAHAKQSGLVLVFAGLRSAGLRSAQLKNSEFSASSIRIRRFQDISLVLVLLLYCLFLLGKLQNEAVAEMTDLTTDPRI